MAILCGIHPVREALRGERPLERILIAQGAGGTRLQEIINEARAKRVPVRFEPRPTLDRAAGDTPHQGVVAYAAAHRFASLEDLPQGELVVVLDGVEDPHNLGAIIRTANAAGASAVMVPERRSAGLTETVAKAAAGALEHTPLVRVNNVNRALEELKERGYWIYGLDERGEPLYGASFTKPTALVLGGEGKGLHEHTRKHCDFVVRIPMYGAISSLNVSVAAGVVLYEYRRQNP
jgi:23S rRNA (guanosine2251-2'-O)-methyltransferase